MIFIPAPTCPPPPGYGPERQSRRGRQVNFTKHPQADPFEINTLTANSLSRTFCRKIRYSTRAYVVVQAKEEWRHVQKRKKKLLEISQIFFIPCVHVLFSLAYYRLLLRPCLWESFFFFLFTIYIPQLDVTGNLNHLKTCFGILIVFLSFFFLTSPPLSFSIRPISIRPTDVLSGGGEQAFKKPIN